MHHLNSRRSGSNACRASSSAPSRRRLWTRSGTSRSSTTGPESARRWAISARRSSRRPIGLRKIHAQRRRKGWRWLRGRFRFRWLRLRGPRSSGCAAAKARARAACACGWRAWTAAATGSAVAGLVLVWASLPAISGICGFEGLVARISGYSSDRYLLNGAADHLGKGRI